ncbi:hypothetical protein J2T12_001705 [Paenibacillus anaericanus]|nr:hypothetical protein [Paenibacillus anaericanus]
MGGMGSLVWVGWDPPTSTSADPHQY